jgi:hypothetical protein
MLLAVDQPGTWQVDYRWGLNPPPGGKVAAVLYAYQLALAMDPSTVGKCRLPKRVTQINRQGVTLAILDPNMLTRDGGVGLAEVDQWIAATNRGNATRPGTVIVPGRTRSARRTG